MDGRAHSWDRYKALQTAWPWAVQVPRVGLRPRRRNCLTRRVCNGPRRGRPSNSGHGVSPGTVTNRYKTLNATSRRCSASNLGLARDDVGEKLNSWRSASGKFRMGGGHDTHLRECEEELASSFNDLIDLQHKMFETIRRAVDE